MLSGRFRTLTRHLLLALAALVVRGRMPCAAVAGIGAAVKLRSERLQALMDRFAEGRLRTRKAFAPRRAKARGERAPGAAAAKAWPEHVAGWLNLVGLNHPSMDVRWRWIMTLQPDQRHLGEFVLGLRAFLEMDGEMRGMLAVSRAGRRDVRWFLRMGDAKATPEILKEPKRPPKPRATRPRAPRRRGDGWAPPAPPKPRRAPGPFETPPGDLTREERVRRGMWVPEPRVIHGAGETDFTPTHLTLDPRRLFVWER